MGGTFCGSIFGPTELDFAERVIFAIRGRLGVCWKSAPFNVTFKKTALFRPVNENLALSSLHSRNSVLVNFALSKLAPEKLHSKNLAFVRLA